MQTPAATPALTIAASSPHDRHFELRNLLPYAAAAWDMPEQPAGWVYWNGTCWSRNPRDAKALTLAEAERIQNMMRDRGTATEIRNAHRLQVIGRVYAPAWRAAYAAALDCGNSKVRGKEIARQKAETLIGDLFPADDVATFLRR
uniref:hypothetical protein n=1 Tax=Cupriavidus gilardii TaxID=82541 RepID=UPI00247908EA|nr:hypothetical protein [Cupriavidus gilardii]WDE72655.1 hypothetical protein [Cupriavidus gilardii]